ncbi:hypothetical protein PISMIDRAFT_372463 [Pisolithus microcarpus 441]|uniref:Uncharacterized protein n=1 Tax=Pisolithus microcarpus 441 TaxID=765257 RepID=A0A0C9ZR23_9AGAM|nr:hypothetical protein PISMIDRAFT_372463 [Pisolithus microcarpus 441]
MRHCVQTTPGLACRSRVHNLGEILLTTCNLPSVTRTSCTSDWGANTYENNRQGHH